MLPRAMTRILMRSIGVWSDIPKAAHRARKLGPTVRIGVVFPYVVFYRYAAADDAVLVLRVLNGRRKITRRVLQQPRSQP